MVLPLDQAEELFSAEVFSAGAAEEAERFLELLAAVIGRINTDEVRLLVAASIRTDRYEAMQNHPALDGVGTALFSELKTMPSHNFRDVIKGPAARASEAGHRLTIADNLVDQVIADAGDGADTLPLLALTLNRLYTDYGSAEEIKLDDYKSMGGMDKVVENQIAEILFADSHDRETALGILHSAFIPWLASFNPDNDQPMRRVAFESELPPESRPLIDAFVDKRLLVRDQREDQVVLEVALESLLRQWDQLRIWLTEERQNLLATADLDREAKTWENSGRNDDYLLAGARLAAAEAVAAKPGFAKRLAGAADYLAASRQREEQRRRDAITPQLVTEAKAMLAQTIPGGDIRAFQQLLAARKLTSKPDDGPILDALVLRSRTLKIIDTGELTWCGALSPDGQRLAVGGYRMGTRLWNVETGQPLGEPLAGHRGPVQSVAFSRDGRHLATASGTTVRVWEADTGQPIGEPLEHPDVVWSVAFSPDGNWLASAGTGRTLQLWDAHTGQPLGDRIAGHTDNVCCVTFSSDGRRLASAGDDQTVRVWDAHTGQPLGNPLTGHTGKVHGVGFSRDGRRLASAGNDKTVRVWDADTGQQLGNPLTGHTSEVSCVAYSPGGQFLASGSWPDHSGHDSHDLTSR
jgi:hypothetical protein